MGSAMFLSRMGPRSLTVIFERAFTSRKASSERQIAPGFAIPSNRAAILTPSPFKSPSLSSTTPPKCMPTRNSMRHSGGTPAFRSTRPVCSSVAQRSASTTLQNPTSVPSPVRLNTRPLCTAMVGSITSLRSALSRAKVRSSSLPVSRLKPTTSAARIAASFRFPVMHPSTAFQTSTVTRKTPLQSVGN